MRRQRLLKTSSAQSICLFCASRLAGSGSKLATPTLRTISTSGRLQQEPAVSGASPNVTDSVSQGPSGFIYDPKSPLSLSEQRQRAFLAERREKARQEEAVRETQRHRQEQEQQLRAQKLREQIQREQEQRAQKQHQQMLREQQIQREQQQQDQQQRQQMLREQQMQREQQLRVRMQKREQSQRSQNAPSVPTQGTQGSRGGDRRLETRHRMQTQNHQGHHSQQRSALPRTTKDSPRAEPIQAVSSPFGQAGSSGTEKEAPPASRSIFDLFNGGGAQNSRTAWGMGSGMSAVRRESVAAAASLREAAAAAKSQPEQDTVEQSAATTTPKETSDVDGAKSDEVVQRGQDPIKSGAAPGLQYGRSPFAALEHARKDARLENDALLNKDHEWSNLRRRTTAPTPQAEDRRPATTQYQDPAWIDATFEKYRADRSPLRHTASSSSPFLSRETGHSPRAPTKCFRCGELGHLVRDCPKSASESATWQPQRYTPFAPVPTSQPRATRGVQVARDQEESDHVKTSVDAAQERRMRKFAIDDKAEDGKESRGRRAFNDDRKRVKNVRRDFEEDDEGLDEEDLIEMRERRARRAEKRAEKDEKNAAKAEKRAAEAEARRKDGIPIQLPEFVTVATLSQLLNIRYETFVERLERLGYDDVFPGKALNSETSGLIAMEFGFDPSPAEEQNDRDLHAQPELADKSLLPVRPPVVTIMGHVDHGKTTILDYLRKSSVAAGEAGGITQHIGAFSVPLAASGKTITFLDTPGHAAFLAMRQRGANVTDIVILVVAADDSVKPQTLEAIKHAQGAGVPMIVAVNKIDKEEADVQRVKQDLARHGVEIEDFGGDTQAVGVSGKTGQGMDELEENVVTLSEILDHRAETDGVAEGWVLEASTKKSGRVATVLVRRGTLRVGSIVVAGKTWARVRTLHNEAGIAMDEVGPGMPAEIDGWRDQPMAGDEVLEAPSEQKANDVVEFRQDQADRSKIADDMDAINQARKARQDEQNAQDVSEEAPAKRSTGYKESGRNEVPFIIKADVSGSAEAVTAYIQTLASPLVSPLILESGVGPIHESDIERADAAKGHIIAFNVTNDEGLKNSAEARGIKVLEHNIIYRVLEDVKSVLEATLPPIITQRVLGEAEIGASFDIGLGGRKTLKIAGCKVRNGVIARNSRVRVTRGEEKVYDGTISSLKNVKKDVQEMRKGTECGMSFEAWHKFEVGDLIQTYEEHREKRRL